MTPESPTFRSLGDKIKCFHWLSLFKLDILLLLTPHIQSQTVPLDIQVFNYFQSQCLYW